MTEHEHEQQIAQSRSGQPQTKQPETEQPADEEARQLAREFVKLHKWASTLVNAEAPRNEVVALIRDYLGAEGVRHSVVSRELAAFEHVNLQTALDAWSAAPGRSVEVRGMTEGPHTLIGLSLQSLVANEEMLRVRLSAPALADLPNGPGSTLACLRVALLLVNDEAGRYIVMINAPKQRVPGMRQPALQVEVAGLPVEAAQRVQADLARLRAELSVYRGRLLDASVNEQGELIIGFATPPELARDDVVLPDTVLARIEAHALGVAGHRQALLDAGQHLKRGLLLYGPPGTGKTHTTRYLLGQMNDYTRVVLTGRALAAVGDVTAMARALAPAVVVLEDVDLVAQDRSVGPTPGPVLFDLLDAMDGAADDADLLFLLTTNRADLLETALAARPGRVDVAVEIALPDADARERLLALYGRAASLALTPQDVTTAVARTDGTTASFMRELIRRAVLEAMRDDSGTVTGEHLARALDELLDASQGVTRALLGVGVNPEDLPVGGALGPARALLARRAATGRLSG